MCDHVGPFEDGSLVCDRTATHDETAATGHTYTTTDGSSVDDRHHADGGHG